MPKPDGYILDKASIESLRREVSGLRHMMQNVAARWRHAHRGNLSTSPKVVYALVNEAGNVATTDDEFDVDGVESILGAVEVTSISDVNNTFDESFLDDDPLLLIWNELEERWEVLGSGGGDIGKVKMDAADPLEYLFGQMNDTGSYSSGSDILVHSQSVDSGGGNDKLRHFVDISAIAGYNASNKQALTHNTGTLGWMDIDEC